MPKTWYNATVQAPGAGGSTFQQDIVLAAVGGRPATLLRTLCFWGASAIMPAPSAVPDVTVQPIGFFCEDGFSQNNPGPAHVGDSPWSISAVDAIIREYSDWKYSDYSVPRKIEGSSNPNLVGGTDYHQTLNVDKLMHVYAGGLVDSHAQRTWFAPNAVTFTFNMEDAGFSTPPWALPAAFNFWAQLHFLMQTF